MWRWGMVCLMAVALAAPASARETGRRTTLSAKIDPNSDYAKFVRRLRDGDTNIDYAAFRQSFTKLPGYDGTDRLDTAPAYAALREGKVGIALDIAVKRLDVAYVDIDAHLIAVAVYRTMGLPDKAAEATAIARGLMTALRATGDGKGPQSAYKPILVGEEYLLANAAGLHVVSREELRGHDVLRATDPKSGAKSDIWFDSAGFSANSPAPDK